LGHDPHRHGRFTAIADRRENGLYRAEKGDALFAILINQLFSTRYDDVHTHLALFQEVSKVVKPVKNLNLGLDIIGRRTVQWAVKSRSSIVFQSVTILKSNGFKELSEFRKIEFRLRKNSKQKKI